VLRGEVALLRGESCYKKEVLCKGAARLYRSEEKRDRPTNSLIVSGKSCFR
jgi:hypothetical protein